MTDTKEPPPWAWAWFYKRIAELTGTTLTANGELDNDALEAVGEEKVRGAMAVIQAEMAAYTPEGEAEMKALDDEKLEGEIVQILGELPEDHPILRLMDGTMPQDERDTMARETFGAMSEEELFDALRQLVPEDRARVRRLLHMDEDDQ